MAALFGWPIEALAFGGVGVMLLLRCMEPEDAWASIDGNTLVLIFGMLAFGKGLENAGTVDLIVAILRPLLDIMPPLLLVVAIYAIASILTEIVTNNAVAVILTPIGYQTNTLVYGAANYRLMDFVKIGVPMNIAVGAAVCCAIIWLY